MKEKIYSKNIANLIHNFLAGDYWRFTFDEQIGVFKFDLRLKGRIKKVKYFVLVKEDEYIVYAIFPLGVDENDERVMAAMAEFICRANYGLKNGNFEFDTRGGEIRFKSYVDCYKTKPSREVIKNSIYQPVLMFNRFGTEIIEIILGYTGAKESSREDEEMEGLISRLTERFRFE